MLRLSGLDAGFLYSETPSLHMHTLKVAVMEHAGGATGWYDFDRFRSVLSANLHRLPPFRRRLAFVPLSLDHPRWIDDDEFDIDRHLLHARASAPGGARELAEIVSKVAGRQLDRRRPLWEITAVGGLAGDRIGFIAKIHHSVADGTAANELLMNVLSLEASPRPEETAPAWVPERAPGHFELLADATRQVASRVMSFPELLRTTAESGAALVRHVRASTVESAVPFRTPPTPFNAALTPNRIFASTKLSLGELREMRKIAGVTLNDVFLAVCTGALRRYLHRRGVLPDQPLIASVPSSTSAEPGRLHGNRVSSLFALLPCHLEHPLERLRVVHAAMGGRQAAKRRDRTGDAGELGGVRSSAPLRGGDARLVARWNG